ncbi:hypothetical protein PPYR_15435 [Photinus pyralis]|uniref:Myb/SANT-like DNA-binding domain-containing protein n=3 Tax=Photinus pyralis TaxID=7054 RepID=A0A5N3ZYU2_PHOPY|nr:uncharacterized protein LOC116159651 [Photinus pyralis]XP_031358893.1 uncharacterized protein LOC116182503 [Photinus pyralis]KAB0790232.1 hypothetical protein PPYR_15435 [Photinus pyralis]
MADVVQVFNCFYCKSKNLTWTEVEKHRCFAGKCLLSIGANNVIYCDEDITAGGAPDEVVTETQEDSQEDALCDKENATVSMENDNAKWSHSAILMLIDEYRKHKNDLEKKNSLKRHIWKKIATNINNEESSSYTWDQIQNKWKSLLRTYKNVKDHNNETGRGRKNWQYFDLMDELLKGNPTVQPPVVINNGEITVCSGSQPSMSAEDSPRNTRSNTPESSNRKRKSSCDMSDLLNSILKQNKQQHEEEMVEKRRFNTLLEKLVNNILNKEQE